MTSSSIYTVFQKKWTTKHIAVTLSSLNLTDFQNSFTVRLGDKLFAVK